MEESLLRNPILQIFMMLFVVPFLRVLVSDILKTWGELMGKPYSEDEEEGLVESLMKLFRDLILK